MVFQVHETVERLIPGLLYCLQTSMLTGFFFSENTNPSARTPEQLLFLNASLTGDNPYHRGKQAATDFHAKPDILQLVRFLAYQKPTFVGVSVVDVPIVPWAAELPADVD